MGGRTNPRIDQVVSVFLPAVLGIIGYSEAKVLMVADILPGEGSSGPLYLTDVDGTLYFSANDGTHGYELWRSDGTTAGTVMIGDLSLEPHGLTNVNGTLYFSRHGGTYGLQQLWKSDGTATGTVLVSDRPLLKDEWFYDRATVDGTLFFVAADTVHGFELWKSDGTESGTAMVKDIFQGESYLLVPPRHLTNVNGTLFFSAATLINFPSPALNDYELYKSDGTASGTVPVKDIDPGTDGSHPASLTTVDGTLFFSAKSSQTVGPFEHEYGYELWKSDGTAAGTVMVKDIDLGEGSSAPGLLTDVNGTLYFSADDGTNGRELWKSDGTAAGTVMVADINPKGDSMPANLTDVDGTLYFSADDGWHGRELWKSDGTAAGTVMVADIRSGERSSVGSEYTNLINVNGTLFLNVDDGTHGRELWKSDGTAAGTVMVADINPGEGSSIYPLYPYGYPQVLMLNVDGNLFFTANDGAHGFELWVYSKYIFVDAAASGAHDGTSWTDAYKYLQDALDAAEPGMKIWVAEGTYKPDANSAHPFGTGAPTSTFQLINDVAVFGGFPSGGGAWSERDPISHETVLSGNIIGLKGRRDNSYHVVTSIGTDPNTILDGFIITGGNADGSLPNERGGGMYIDGSPTVRNCVFSENRANAFGGGICTHWDGYSKPVLTNCVFTGNYAGSGGGMLNHASSEAMLVNCIFLANWAVNGGGMHNYIGEPSVINCTFSGNSATNMGGGIYNNDSNLILTNSTLVGNSANEGGGLYNYNSSPALTNCILWGNQDSGGVNESAQIYRSGGTPKISRQP